jgi:hypothetical protein
MAIRYYKVEFEKRPKSTYMKMKYKNEPKISEIQVKNK